MRPFQPSSSRSPTLGPLEQEIVHILWQLGWGSVRDILDRILADPNRELSAPSVLTVLRRLEKKAWVKAAKHDRVWHWQVMISPEEVKVREAYAHLQAFLSVGDAEVVAFANQLDHASMDKLSQITQRLQAIRAEREPG